MRMAARVLTELASGHDGEFFAEDFGVVADVGGEGAEEEEVFDLGGVGTLLGEFSQLGCELGPVAFGGESMFRPRLDKDDGALAAALAKSYKCRAIDPGVLIENGFTGDGEERAARRHDAVRFATAEPEAVAF